MHELLQHKSEDHSDSELGAFLHIASLLKMQTERKPTKEVMWQQSDVDKWPSVRLASPDSARRASPDSDRVQAHPTAWRHSRPSLAVSIASSVATGMITDDEPWGDITFQSMFAATVSPEGSIVRLKDDEYSRLTSSDLYQDKTKEVEEWKIEYYKAWREKKLTEFKAQKQAQETDRGIEAILRQRFRMEKEAKKERELRRIEEGLPGEEEAEEEEKEEKEDKAFIRELEEIKRKLTGQEEFLPLKASSEEIIEEVPDINRELSQWYITKAEMNQLNFDEELLVVDEKHVVRGTWRVQFELSTQEFFHVVFEGITREETGECHAVNHTGWVSPRFLPERDFRVEQFSTGVAESSNEPNRRRSHRKSVPRTSDEVRRDSTFHETRQPGVKKQSKMLYTQRVEGNFWVQTNRRTDDQGQDNSSRRIIDSNSMKHCLTDAAFLILLRKMARKGFIGKIKAKTMVMTGDICPVTIYSHPPRPVTLNGVELHVTRIKRKLMTPREKESISNFFLTSLGQLVAVRHKHDPFGLQIDLNAVLSNEKIIPPARCVPLRKRYLYDPVLNDYFLSQVEEMSYLNELYLHDHPEIMEMLTYLLNGLLLDKPHRVVAYVQNYFLRTI